MASRVFWLATRVARFCGSAASFVFHAKTAGANADGRSPRIAASNASASARAACRFCQLLRALLPWLPTARQLSNRSAGMSKASNGQSSAARAAAISVSPSGAPCTPEVPCLAGAPKPITVLQRIRLGRSSAFAAVMAADTASISCPSHASTCQL